ncbi:MAG TPA: nucleosidase [Rhodospirillaceae bacterium]|jgi:adenosylhomocysteine nucleosidase|nr:nucleosidase [Alphaproteobacteria bacterium]HBH25895.1 nucleosidase [Rhodospirillaceae bacterium]
MTLPLIVFALESESRGLFAPHRVLHTGVGKVNAAHALTKAIDAERPGVVINLGSAGSAVHAAGSVVACTAFVQRDMDVTPLGFAPHATPFDATPVPLVYGHPVPGLPEATCGTGDRFETAHTGGGYDIVDMEAFALALVCQREDVPFACLKYISDGADGAAAQDWGKALEDGAAKLRAALGDFLRAFPI